MQYEGTPINVPIKGIMRAGTTNNAPDGAMNEVVGMEYKDGSWLPYKEKEEESTVDLSGRDVIGAYVHKLSDSEDNQLYLVRESGSDNLYLAENSELQPTPIVTNVSDVSFIGNILCVTKTDNNEASYYLWVNNSYMKQGVPNSDYPNVSIRTNFSFMYENRRLEGIRHCEVYTENNAGGTCLLGVLDPDVYRSLLHSGVFAALGEIRDRGGLTGYSVGCVAFRLKNGSFVNASAPVLLCRPMSRYGNYEEGFREVRVAQPHPGDYNGDVFIDANRNQVKVYQFQDANSSYPSGYTLFEGNIYNDVSVLTVDGVREIISPEDSGSYIEGVHPLNNAHLYIQATTPQSFLRNNLCVPTLLSNIVAKSSVNTEGKRLWYFYTYAAGCGLQYYIDSIDKDKLDALGIESICIFISQEISPFVIKEKEEEAYKMFGYGYDMMTIFNTDNTTSTGYKGVSRGLVPRKSKEIIDEIKKTNTLYLVKEIYIEDIDNVQTWTDVSLDGKLGDNLVLQEQLPLSAYDKNNTYAKYVDSYNMRAHLYNYRQRLFDGFPYGMIMHNGGDGNYPVISLPGASTTGGGYYKWEIIVKLVENNAITKLVRCSEAEVSGIVSSLSPILSYTNPHATSMRIRLYNTLDNTTWYEKEFPLTAWRNLNMSIYIDPELKPINIAEEAKTSGFPQSIPAYISENNIRTFSNGMKVSDVAYPMYFPVAYTYRIGKEEIIGLATLTTPVSQDNFGNNQLIVFCTDGIYSMTVDTSGNGAYTSIPPRVSPEVCVNRNSICEIGGAIFFAGDKGLMVLTGDNQVQLYASHLNGKPQFLPASTGGKEAHGIYKTMIDNVHILSKAGDSFADSISNEDFIEFIKDEHTHLIYISIKNKLLAYNDGWGTHNNPLYDFSYFIDIPTGNTTKLSMRAECDNGDIIGKTLLAGYSTGNARHYNEINFLYESETCNDIPCLVQSRPIKVQQDDKCSYRVVLTGYFEGLEGNWADIVVMGSIDGDNWRVIGVKEKKLVGGFHNFGCLTERGSWKYLMFIFGGKLSDKSHIDSVDITVDGRYNNKKR